MRLIASNREGSNKELKKMRKDIEAIIAKYTAQEDI
jgi:septum formation topological specificity factor MinE